MQSTLTDQNSGVVLDELTHALSDTVRRRLRETSTVHQQGSLASKLHRLTRFKEESERQRWVEVLTSLLTGTPLSSPPVLVPHPHPHPLRWASCCPRRVQTRFLEAAAGERAR